MNPYRAPPPSLILVPRRVRLGVLPGAIVLLSAVDIAKGCFPADHVVEAAAGYEAQQMACVDRNDTREAIDACRAKVRAAWTVVDAGADCCKVPSHD